MHKLTTLDYPGVVSAVLFTQGCNFHCPYCHNRALIPGKGCAAPLEPAEVLAFLKKRAGLLDGLVISGGEPTLQSGLYDFCRAAKSLGYAIKLDTNGSRPDVLGRLLEAGLLDYVAMDCKTVLGSYYPDFSPDADIADAVTACADLLRKSGLAHEFRTTCVSPYITAELLPGFTEIIGTASPWFLQKAHLGKASQALLSVSTEDREQLALSAEGMGMKAIARPSQPPPPRG